MRALEVKASLTRFKINRLNLISVVKPSHKVGRCTIEVPAIKQYDAFLDQGGLYLWFGQVKVFGVIVRIRVYDMGKHSIKSHIQRDLV